MMVYGHILDVTYLKQAYNWVQTAEPGMETPSGWRGFYKERGEVVDLIGTGARGPDRFAYSTGQKEHIIIGKYKQTSPILGVFDILQTRMEGEIVSRFSITRYWGFAVQVAQNEFWIAWPWQK